MPLVSISFLPYAHLSIFRICPSLQYTPRLRQITHDKFNIFEPTKMASRSPHSSTPLSAGKASRMLRANDPSLARLGCVEGEA